MEQLNILRSETLAKSALYFGYWSPRFGFLRSESEWPRSYGSDVLGIKADIMMRYLDFLILLDINQLVEDKYNKDDELGSG